ncbi:copper amine oxidase N-terminal domain-containing protein [uncultured Tyzzerella sp.]|uniref:copper amine oxidase N-terminal domain-containing protein n=1 Tax=uncultured Tyzzerella sp. TaxID=2321398 RepID=UPI002941EB40|nr:copper amine oxidase N-terminal domain-containing protein [uncultured Tyzzerella sp.]
MKKILNIFLSFILIFSFKFEVFANSVNVTLKTINSSNNINIFGEYPNISGLTNISFQNNVNKKIEGIIKSKITSYSKKITSKIEISYDTIKDGNILSIIIYFKSLYNNEVSPYSVNIDTKNNKYVTINSYFNANGLNYTNKVVSNKASSMGITYKKVTENTPFYIKNKNVYVVFGAGSLTFSQKGNIIFEVPYKNLKNYKIDKQNYYKKSQYNVKMVPLRESLDYFGYIMNWESSKNSITILKDGKFLSYLVIGENRYSDKNNKIIRQLEFAPEIKNGKAYVPISYFNEILGMLFAVDDNEDIIISSYKI